jgi:hypothetical protein
MSDITTKEKRDVQMTKGKVLVLGSNATRIEVQGGGTGPTGNYLKETVVPATALIEAGYNLVLVVDPHEVFPRRCLAGAIRDGPNGTGNRSRVEWLGKFKPEGVSAAEASRQPFPQ